MLCRDGRRGMSRRNLLLQGHELPLELIELRRSRGLGDEVGGGGVEPAVVLGLGAHSFVVLSESSHDVGLHSDAQRCASEVSSLSESAVSLIVAGGWACTSGSGFSAPSRTCWAGGRGTGRTW